MVLCRLEPTRIDRVRTHCIADTAEEAPFNRTDRLALHKLSEDAVSDEESMTIACPRQSCDGCVRLILENAGLEVEGCEKRSSGVRKVTGTLAQFVLRQQ